MEFLPVVPDPQAIWCAALTYLSHVREGGDRPVPDHPLFFLRLAGAQTGHRQPLVIPRVSDELDYEGELAVVIGRMCKDVEPQDVRSVIFGYTCANDVTARDLQEPDRQWARAKGFDTFCPLGPVIETELSPHAVLRTRLNGELKQEAPISDMVHDIPSIVAYASSVFTLLPGDVILTGTPSGIGPMKPGDTVEVEVDGVGSLVNPVRAPK